MLPGCDQIDRCLACGRWFELRDGIWYCIESAPDAPAQAVSEGEEPRPWRLMPSDPPETGSYIWYCYAGGHHWYPALVRKNNTLCVLDSDYDNACETMSLKVIAGRWLPIGYPEEKP